MRELVLATRNPGKVAEIKRLLEGMPIVVRTLEEFPDIPEIQEDALTLKDNARKKAWAVYRATGLPTLADDTGLEVDALGGRPGVFSARYAGPQATDAENRARLLQEMAGQKHRRARFRTVVVLIDNEGEHLFEGVCEGTIGEEERGEEGFGYDPLFIPEEGTRTFAELQADEKNAISHRGKALRQVIAYLKERLGKHVAE